MPAGSNSAKISLRRSIMNMQFAYITWAVVFIAYATVALMRWSVARREDDHLHFADSEQQLLASQTSLAHKLDVLDRWKTLLLVATLVLGVVIGATHAYMVWQQSSSAVRMS
jgi:hypothetical protein